jgi:VIT1/CCC1 family predicted Fe2+/Mn2+ transporter
MARGVRHGETHSANRIGWLRAAVLGANDGVISTASLVVGVSAAGDHRQVLLAAVAGLVAGSMSMAAGEYVSVSSQADAEKADLARERRELKERPSAEQDELTQIYVGRGLQPILARQVAQQLMAKDALAAHARDELGISTATIARPIQAALASATSFAAGAALPLVLVLAAPGRTLGVLVPLGSLVGLFLLGALGAKAGGAGILRASVRVTFWGAIAMAITAGIGHLLGAVV